MTILRLSVALFLLQAGFHAYTASLPLALARAGAPDASIGLIMGVAAVVQIPGAIAGGRLLDAFGGARLFIIAGLAYVAAAAILLLPGTDPAAGLAPFVVARVLQGAGLGLALPAALSMVPRLVPAMRQAASLAYIGAAHNVALMIMPALSIAIMNSSSLRGVDVLVVGMVLAGLLLSRRLPTRDPEPSGTTGMAAASRRFGITYRREWTAPLVIVVLYVAHWGVVTSYLPIRAEAAGADIGLFFAADGISIVAMRLVTGSLVGRFSLRLLILVGAGMTAASLGLLLLPLTTPILLLCGLLGGTGGAIVMTPITIELSRRSADADRGSAFALFSGGLAAAMTIGSIGGAPIVALFGMGTGLVAGIAMILVAMVLTAVNRPLAEPVLTGAEPVVVPVQAEVP
ncbi:MAG: MFS transporter [Chloroflexota bacterium]